VQIDPIKPAMKAPGTKRLKLKYDKRLSICFNFGYNFNLRRYNMDGKRAADLCDAAAHPELSRLLGRGLHSSTFQFNLSRFCHSTYTPQTHPTARTRPKHALNTP